VRIGRGHTSLELRNRLLASLQTEDLRLFERHLREVPIEQGEMLEEPGRFVDGVYFPQNGMISLIVQMPEDSSVEVGTVGSEGAVGMAVGLGSRVSFICALVQVSGTALCIPASRFRNAAGQSARIRDLIARYSELQLGQIQQTAGCNALHDVPSRLSRWLLQTSDKIGSDTIPFTHEFLGKMLGVRRSTVTQALSEFHAAGLLDGHRGQIILLRRGELKEKACPCYEIVRGTSTDWCLILTSETTEMVGRERLRERVASHQRLEAAAAMTQGRATISISRGQQRRTRDRPKQMQ
jgi:CRP-like cAMP-binding protein